MTILFVTFSQHWIILYCVTNISYFHIHGVSEEKQDFLYCNQTRSKVSFESPLSNYKQHMRLQQFNLLTRKTIISCQRNTADKQKPKEVCNTSHSSLTQSNKNWNSSFKQSHRNLQHCIEKVIPVTHLRLTSFALMCPYNYWYLSPLTSLQAHYTSLNASFRLSTPIIVIFSDTKCEKSTKFPPPLTLSLSCKKLALLFISSQSQQNAMMS